MSSSYTREFPTRCPSPTTRRARGWHWQISPGSSRRVSPGTQRWLKTGIKWRSEEWRPCRRQPGRVAIRARIPAAKQAEGCPAGRRACFQGADPVVVDAFAVDELEPQIAQARRSRRVRLEWRVHRVFDYDDSVAGFGKTDRRVRHAHIGLESDE